MKNKLAHSTKRLQIDKANTTIVVTVAVAAFIATFSLVATRALWSQRGYQDKVIAQKEVARDQLEVNIAAVTDLAVAYNEFTDRPQNVIGGNPAGDGVRDGDNAKIILDALPSKYDFPALTTSLEALATDGRMVINSISGTDDEVAQQGNETEAPAPVEIPFTLEVSSGYENSRDFMRILERSIRPMKMTVLTLSGSDADLTTRLEALTYYLPEKSLSIVEQEVK